MDLATRINNERTTRNWSLTELAERSGVSRSMIHKIESGTSSPTAEVLVRIAAAFGMTMSVLIARAEAQGGRLARASEQLEWRDPKTGYLRRQLSPPGSNPLELTHVDLPAGAKVPMPAGSYAFIAQLIWVIEGQLVFYEGNARHVLNQEDCLQLGPPQDCIFANESAVGCRYVVALGKR